MNQEYHTKETGIARYKEIYENCVVDSTHLQVYERDDVIDGQKTVAMIPLKYHNEKTELFSEVWLHFNSFEDAKAVLKSRKGVYIGDMLEFKDFKYGPGKNLCTLKGLKGIKLNSNEFQFTHESTIELAKRLSKAGAKDWANSIKNHGNNILKHQRFYEAHMFVCEPRIETPKILILELLGGIPAKGTNDYDSVMKNADNIVAALAKSFQNFPV